MIETVRGKILPDEMGITMSHEHLCLNLSSVRKDDDSIFGFEPRLLSEVRRAVDLGVTTFVEVTCNDMGRNVEELKKISEEYNIHVIASTGFYLDEYHSDIVKSASIEELANIFIKDLTIGIDNTSIRAGVIGEVASSNVMTPSEKKILQAAAIAANKVGCAITTHCQLGQLGEVQASIFLNAQVNPDKVILGHIDLSDDVDYMISLIKLGFNIGFDTIGKEAYLSDSKRAENLYEIIKRGFIDKIVLSQDISRKSYFYNGSEYFGYATVLEKFIPMLIDIGIEEKDINKLLIDNPKRIFNIT